MLPRNTAFLVVAFLFVAAGCGDTPTRATSPRDAHVLLNQTPGQNSYYVQWIQEFTTAGGNLQGQALSHYNAIADATDKGAALNALIAYMIANRGSLSNPSRQGADPDLDSQLALFFTAVAQYHGLIAGSGDGLLDVEHLVTILYEDDIPLNGHKCFSTNEKNAAMCLTRNSLNFPAFVSIIDRTTNNVYTFPPGVTRVGKIFDYDAYGSVSGDVVVLLCTPGHGSPTPNYGIAKRPVLGSPYDFDLMENNAGSEFPTACEDFHQPELSLIGGNSLFARSVNAAGTFLLSAVTPKSLYATHSLAHRGTAFSDWTLVEVQSVQVKVVGVNSGGFTTNSFSLGRNTGNLVFYVEVYLNGELETCGPDNTNIVKARPYLGTVAQPEVTATACSFHGSTGTHRHQITFPNPAQGTRITNGSVTFTVNDYTATGWGGNPVTFTTN